MWYTGSTNRVLHKSQCHSQGVYSYSQCFAGNTEHNPQQLSAQQAPMKLSNDLHSGF